MKKNSDKFNKRTVKLTHSELLGKLEALDEKLVNIWLTQESRIPDEDVWEMFVVLLETRVEILKTCKSAGVVLSAEMCLPEWLEKLARRKQELRLREIKVMAEELKKRKQINQYGAHLVTSEEITE